MQKQGKKRSFLSSRLYFALHKDLLKQAEVEWKIDGDVLHYYCVHSFSENTKHSFLCNPEHVEWMLPF